MWRAAAAAELQITARRDRTDRTERPRTDETSCWLVGEVVGDREKVE